MAPISPMIAGKMDTKSREGRIINKLPAKAIVTHPISKRDAFSFKNNKAIINYSRELSDTYDDGYDVCKEVKNSTRRYSVVKSISGGLSFDTIDVVCFDENSTKHLFDFSSTFQSDSTWKNSVVNVQGEEFKKGVQVANEE